MEKKKPSYSRKTHKKSRTGCRTCLRRHIRCDERKPRCKNCAYRVEPCEYPNAVVSYRGRQQLASAHDSFMQHAPNPEYPFSLLDLETTDRGLWHHISSISHTFQSQRIDRFTVLVRQLPVYLAIGYEYDFVQQALLAMSATQLEWMTGKRSSDPTSSPEYYRGQAIQGLRKALNCFCKRNSDALLAASVILLWQSSTPDDWSAIESGIGSLISSMGEWEEDSMLKEHIQMQRPYLKLPPSIGANIIWKREQRDLERLQELYQSFEEVSQYIQDNREESQIAYKMLTIIRQLQICSSTLDKSGLFQLCQPIRTYAIWTPVICEYRIRTNPMTMVFLAHVYATAVVMGHIYGLTNMTLDGGSLPRRSITPIFELYRGLIVFSENEEKVKDMVKALELMQYPMKAVAAFQARITEVKKICNISLPE